MLQAFGIGVAEGIVTGVAPSDEGKIVFKLLDGGDKFGLQIFFAVKIGQPFLQVGNMSIAAQDLKAVANLMNSVMDGFQLGGFVNNVFGSGNLAAVMQPRGNVQGIPVIGTHLKIFERTVGLFNRGGSQQTSDNRNLLAMAAGVGGFGIYGTSQNLNKRLQQLRISLAQRFVL